MKNKDMTLLLELIDKRIRKVLKEERICYRYIGKVQGEPTDTYAINVKTPISLLGFTANDGIYNLMNRSSSNLAGGDLVYIDTIGSNLNSGVITQVYKFNNELFIN